MASRMTDATDPLSAESSSDEGAKSAPQVKVLLTHVEGADFDAAIATVKRQVYDPAPQVVIVGEAATSSDELEKHQTLEAAISAAGPETDFLWILHSDARPRPDALSALVAEVERAGAALGGSKLLVAGSHEVLESVGSATDVFGEPYSGLDEGEIDLQQYDVVREVAFVSSTSMLVRRDLAQGLGGLDGKLPPAAAGLDFSQRARLAGGSVIAVPSSEVYHQGRCEVAGSLWREEAGRLRAMVIAYSPLTLLWLLPYDLLVSILDSLASLLLLRWRPAVTHLMSFGWNLFRLPSTFGRRRRFRTVRALGDEELFRFQARGSVRLRSVGAELANRILSLFDDDQALAKSSRRVWASPGIWGGVVAVFVLGFAVRSIVFTGLPNIGGSFPFEPGQIALDRWFGGWNESGLGSPGAVHPSVSITGLAAFLWFGAPGAARTLLTIGFALSAIIGMGRLAGKLGLRGPGRYLAGLVLIAGPGTSVLAGSGSWLALAAAGVLPWATRATFVHDHDAGRTWLARYGWAIIASLALFALSPALGVVPLVVTVLWRVWGGRESRIMVGVVMLVGVAIALQFVLADSGWFLDSTRSLGIHVDDYWSVLLVLAFLPLTLAEDLPRRIASVGGLIALGALIAVRLPDLGPGLEEAILVLSSFGAALVVSAGLDRFSGRARYLMALIASGAILVFSVGALADGRLGLPAGDLNERLGFSVTLAPEQGPGRTLLVSTQRSEIPGEARPGPGYWYRLVDAAGITHDEVWLPDERAGDEALGVALETITSGSELRPGRILAPFAIDWLVLTGPESPLDKVLLAQLDLIPIPLDEESRVFENPQSVAMADAGSESSWFRSGTGFVGDAGSGRVALALNHAEGWSPDSQVSTWRGSVSAADGKAAYRAGVESLAIAWATGAIALTAMGMVLVGRRRP